MIINKEKIRLAIFTILITIVLMWVLMCLVVTIYEGNRSWWNLGFIPYGFILIALAVALYLPRFIGFIKKQGRSNVPLVLNKNVAIKYLLESMGYLLGSAILIGIGLWIVGASNNVGGTVTVGGLPIGLICFFLAVVSAIIGLIYLYFLLVQIFKYTIWKLAHRDKPRSFRPAASGRRRR